MRTAAKTKQVALSHREAGRTAKVSWGTGQGLPSGTQWEATNGSRGIAINVKFGLTTLTTEQLCTGA